MHERHPLPEDRNDRQARAAAALVALARLMGRQAAREHFAASAPGQEEHGEEAVD